MIRTAISPRLATTTVTRAMLIDIDVNVNHDDRVSDGNRWAVRDARERSHTQRHQQLLAAAEQVFAERGYDEATMADITTAAGVSRATAYVYFSSKEAVLRALAQEVVADFIAAQEVPPGDPWDVLTQTCRRTAQSLWAHGPLLEIITERSRRDDEIRALHDELWHRPVRRFVRYLERERAAGTIDPVGPSGIVAEFISSTLRTGALERRTQSRSAQTRFVDSVIDVGATLIGIDPPSRNHQEHP